MTKKEDDDEFNLYGDDPTQGSSSSRPAASRSTSRSSRPAGIGNSSSRSVNLTSSSYEKKPARSGRVSWFNSYSASAGSSSRRPAASRSSAGNGNSPSRSDNLRSSSYEKKPARSWRGSRFNSYSRSAGSSSSRPAAMSSAGNFNIAFGSLNHGSVSDEKKPARKVSGRSSCTTSYATGDWSEGRVSTSNSYSGNAGSAHLSTGKSKLSSGSCSIAGKMDSGDAPSSVKKSGIKIPLKLTCSGITKVQRTLPTIKEWFQLEDCCDQMRELSETSLHPTEYSIDDSEASLFKLHRSGQLKIKKDPLFKPFMVLLRKFWASNSAASVSRKACKEFISNLSDTSIFRFLFEVVRRRDPKLFSIRQFCVALEDIWFGRGKNDVNQCTFRHYFAGDVNEDGSLSGLHNLYQIGQQCQNQSLVATGYQMGYNQIGMATVGLPGKQTKVSSFFEGLLPALEVGILSAVVLMGRPYLNYVGQGQYVQWYGKQPNRSHSLYPVYHRGSGKL